MVAVLMLLSMLTALTQTIVVPILGKISEALGESPTATGWAVTVNLLAAAVLTPLMSKAGDLHGRRRVLLAVLASVAIGSLLGAMTSSLWALLVARVLQGASFCIFPLSIGVMREHLTPRRLPFAMSLLTGMISVGAGAGLVVTGVLTHGDRDYRTVFWMAGAVSVVLFALTLLLVPRDRSRGRGRLDWAGSAVLGAALVLFLLPITQGNSWGWTSRATLGAFTASAAVFVLWWWLQSTTTEPLLRLEVLRHPTLAAVNLVGFFIGFGVFLIFLALPPLVQAPAEHGGFSASVLETSMVYLLPAALIGVVASPVGGALVTRFGGRAALVTASVIGVAGYAQLALWHAAPWQIVLGGVLTNAAFNMGFAAVPAVIVSIVDHGETAIANAVSTLGRSAGSAMGSAMMVALLAGHLGPSGHPDEGAYVTAFLIGLATMAVSLLVSVVAVPPPGRTAARVRTAAE